MNQRIFIYRKNLCGDPKKFDDHDRVQIQMLEKLYEGLYYRQCINVEYIYI